MKAILPIVALAFASCTSTHVMVGTARPPTDPATVRIFHTPPAKYEEIALVQSDNLGTSGFTQQGRVNSAMKRLRENAAKLGANGIILKGIEDGGGATMVSGYSANGAYTATAIPTGHLIKKVSGVAIWVEP
jgi:hypothetical protein